MQHLGLAEDVLDHRLNARTVYLNPISTLQSPIPNRRLIHNNDTLTPTVL